VAIIAHAKSMLAEALPLQGGIVRHVERVAGALGLG
jgi:hypothetical protein